jgi:hypothetical protein
MVSAEVLATSVSHRNAGFRTVYAFSETDAAAIRATGTSQGLAYYTPCADTLTIDLDDGDKTLPILLDRILERGLRCEVWSSGGKGYHLVLSHPLICDKRLPYSHARFVEQLAAGLKFDDTLYRASSLISLPGRLHNKTKRKKRLIEIWEGDNAVIELKEKPPASFHQGSDVTMLQEAVSHLQDLSVRQPRQGQRHNRIWLCARCFAEAGISIDTAMELLTAVNDSWEEPKTESEVTTAVTQAYKG